MWLIFILCLVYNIHTVLSDEDCNPYTKYCSKAELRRSYVKIYQNRNGPLLEEGGPKFYTTSHYSNIYVCLNGPAWLYFARHTAIGDVYHEPEFKVYEHGCQAFNGLPLTNGVVTPVVLMGIFLLGNEFDYTLPSIHLFTAPLLDATKTIYENTTSIFTFGDQPCTITRGKDTTITVIPKPDDQPNPKAITGPVYCKLSYQSIDAVYDKTKVVAGAAPDPKTIDPEVIKALLKNDESLKEGKCKATYHGPAGVEEFKKKLDAAKTKWAKDITTEFEKLVPALGVVSKAAPQLTGITYTAAIPGPPIIPASATFKVEPTTTIDTAIATEQAIINDNTKTPAEIDAAKKQKQKLENDLEQLKSANYAADVYLDATTNQTAFDPTFATVDPLYIAANTTLDSIPALKQAVKDKEAADKTQPTYQTDLDTAKAALKTAEEITLPDDLKKAEDDFLLKETMARQTLETIKKALAAIDAILKLKKGNPFVEPKVSSSTILEIQREYAVPPLPGAAAGTPSTQQESCLALVSVEEACSNAKPNLNRACQFLKAITDGPAICTQDENQDPKTAAFPPLPDVKELLGNLYDIINLIEDIFSHACQKLDTNFAKRVNRIFMCYLLKPKINGGAGIDMRNPPPPDDDTWKDDKWRKKVKESLESCKKEKFRLRFKQDRTSGKPNHFVLALTNHTAKFTKEIFLHKEQADLQYGFNFALDMHFKVFSTVMGLCMASEVITPRNALMTSTFYAGYTKLMKYPSPIEAQWLDPKDNQIFSLILGNYKNNNMGNFWGSRCMEASFIKSADTNYRPLRPVSVNRVKDSSEGNYFITGLLSNTPDGRGNFPIGSFGK